MATGHKCYPNMERFDGQKCQLHDTIVAIYDNTTPCGANVRLLKLGVLFRFSTEKFLNQKLF